MFGKKNIGDFNTSVCILVRKVTQNLNSSLELNPSGPQKRSICALFV